MCTEKLNVCETPKGLCTGQLDPAREMVLFIQLVYPSKKVSG